VSADRKPNVALVGTLDTKGEEYAFLRQRIEAAGVEVTMVDVGVMGSPSTSAEVTREEIAELGGTTLEKLVEAGDRGEALRVMSRGAAAALQRLHAEGRITAVGGLGGTGGSSLISYAMRALPIGFPKLLVSTVAAGDTRPYVESTDMSLMCSVVDIAGVNQISAPILANAAGSLAGMASVVPPDTSSSRPVIGATMFGVTTPCVTTARERLEELGYEVLVFHATGLGGKSLEALIDAGLITGVLDATTTELADNLVGGVFDAGPDRLTAAGSRGLPQVVSLGALDMVNFGPIDTVPERFRERNLYKHNETVTLMRTTPEECAKLGEQIARKLNAAEGPTALFIPAGGISMIATEGGPFHDPAADDALLSAIKSTLDGGVELREYDCDINAPEFALAIADRLHEMYVEWGAKKTSEVKNG
jgi:uncharacterized protein (UPF0261 family)